MDAVMTVDVLVSPAVTVLCDLERDGFTIALEAGGTLRISPRSKLTPDRMHEITACREALRLLVRACDIGVQDRRSIFAKQLASPPAGVLIPQLLFRAGIPYAKAICFSCGDPLARPVFGRCWRCALAWRLAARVPIPTAFVETYNSAKVAG